MSVKARKKRVEFRVNDDEYEKLVALADAAGVAIGEYLRDYIKSQPDPRSKA